MMLFFIVGCDIGHGGQKEVKKNMVETKSVSSTATFAGGCFWCVESDFEKVPGVLKVVSGYTGGTGDNPTYETYAGKGYVEAVQVFYDPAKVTYEQLLDVFWRHIDPTDGGGQFGDRGSYYRSAIFYHDEEQRRLAEKSKEELGKTGITRITTRKTPSATSITGMGRGGTSFWKRFGARIAAIYSPRLVRPMENRTMRPCGKD
jgi:peptide methionine sulfoxide reductase msrA/msrB